MLSSPLLFFLIFSGYTCEYDDRFERAEVLATLKKQQEDSISMKNPFVANVAATIFALEDVRFQSRALNVHAYTYACNMSLDTRLLQKGLGLKMYLPCMDISQSHVIPLIPVQNYTEALKCLHNSSYLENIGLTVQLLLKMDRVDLAR